MEPNIKYIANLSCKKMLKIEFNIHVSVRRNSILIYIQQGPTLHSLFYMETTLHVSGGIITHHEERKQLYLQHLVFVTRLLLSAAIVEELELVCVCCGWRTTLPRYQPAATYVCNLRSCNTV
jgi:hypothetical protein